VQGQVLCVVDVDGDGVVDWEQVNADVVKMGSSAPTSQGMVAMVNAWRLHDALQQVFSRMLDDSSLIPDAVTYWQQQLRRWRQLEAEMEPREQLDVADDVARRGTRKRRGGGQQDGSSKRTSTSHRRRRRRAQQPPSRRQQLDCRAAIVDVALVVRAPCALLWGVPQFRAFARCVLAWIRQLHTVPYGRPIFAAVDATLVPGHVARGMQEFDRDPEFDATAPSVAGLPVPVLVVTSAPNVFCVPTTEAARRRAQHGDDAGPPRDAVDRFTAVAQQTVESHVATPVDIFSHKDAATIRQFQHIGLGVCRMLGSGTPATEEDERPLTLGSGFTEHGAHLRTVVQALRAQHLWPTSVCGEHRFAHRAGGSVLLVDPSVCTFVCSLAAVAASSRGTTVVVVPARDRDQTTVPGFAKLSFACQFALSSVAAIESVGGATRTDAMEKDVLRDSSQGDKAAHKMVREQWFRLSHANPFKGHLLETLLRRKPAKKFDIGKGVGTRGKRGSAARQQRSQRAVIDWSESPLAGTSACPPWSVASPVRDWAQASSCRAPPCCSCTTTTLRTTCCTTTCWTTTCCTTTCWTTTCCTTVVSRRRRRRSSSRCGVARRWTSTGTTWMMVWRTLAFATPRRR